MRKKIMILGFMLLAFMGKVMAEDYLTTFDITNEKIVIEKSNVNSVGMTFNMKVENFVGTTDGDGHNVVGKYAYFVNAATDPFNNDLLPVDDQDGCAFNINASEHLDGLIGIYSDSEIDVPGRWYMLEKYDYVYLAYTYSDATTLKRYCKVSSAPIKLNKDEQLPLLPLDQRYNIAVGLDDEHKQMSLFLNFPTDELNPKFVDISIKTKIGLITDVTLMEALRSDYNGNLTNLLNYAKNDAQNVILDRTTELVESGMIQYNDISDATAKIKATGIYYVYNTAVTNSTIPLRNIEGISIVKSAPYYDDNKVITGYYLAKLDNWDGVLPGNKASVDPAPAPTNTGTVPNPKTGVFVGVIGLTVIAIVVSSLFFKHKKQFYKI